MTKREEVFAFSLIEAILERLPAGRQEALLK